MRRDAAEIRPYRRRIRPSASRGVLASSVVMYGRMNARRGLAGGASRGRGPDSGRGSPLPGDLQAAAERLFGGDFASVRIHVGPEAARLRALAFTLGEHIWFAPGVYDPRGAEGLRILGHELAHVVQQREGRVRNPYGYGVAVVRDEALEAEADRLGARFAASVGADARGPRGAAAAGLDYRRARK